MSIGLGVPFASSYVAAIFVPKVAVTYGLQYSYLLGACVCFFSLCCGVIFIRLDSNMEKVDAKYEKDKMLNENLIIGPVEGRQTAKSAKSFHSRVSEYKQK